MRAPPQARRRRTATRLPYLRERRAGDQPDNQQAEESALSHRLDRAAEAARASVFGAESACSEPAPFQYAMVFSRRPG